MSPSNWSIGANGSMNGSSQFAPAPNEENMSFCGAAPLFGSAKSSGGGTKVSTAGADRGTKGIGNALDGERISRLVEPNVWSANGSYDDGGIGCGLFGIEGVFGNEVGWCGGVEGEETLSNGDAVRSPGGGIGIDVVECCFGRDFGIDGKECGEPICGGELTCANCCACCAAECCPRSGVKYFWVNALHNSFVLLFVSSSYSLAERRRCGDQHVASIVWAYFIACALMCCSLKSKFPAVLM